MRAFSVTEELYSVSLSQIARSGEVVIQTSPTDRTKPRIASRVLDLWASSADSSLGRAGFIVARRAIERIATQVPAAMSSVLVLSSPLLVSESQHTENEKQREDDVEDSNLEVHLN